MNKRKPKPQTGFASLSSFSMQELAEVIVNGNKPNQDETRNIQNTRQSISEEDVMMFQEKAQDFYNEKYDEYEGLFNNIANIYSDER